MRDVWVEDFRSKASQRVERRSEEGSETLLLSRMKLRSCWHCRLEDVLVWSTTGHSKLHIIEMWNESDARYKWIGSRKAMDFLKEMGTRAPEVLISELYTTWEFRAVSFKNMQCRNWTSRNTLWHVRAKNIVELKNCCWDVNAAPGKKEASDAYGNCYKK